MARRRASAGDGRGRGRPDRQRREAVRPRDGEVAVPGHRRGHLPAPVVARGGRGSGRAQDLHRRRTRGHRARRAGVARVGRRRLGGVRSGPARGFGAAGGDAGGGAPHAVVVGRRSGRLPGHPGQDPRGGAGGRRGGGRRLGRRRRAGRGRRGDRRPGGRGRTIPPVSKYGIRSTWTPCRSRECGNAS